MDCRHRSPNAIRQPVVLGMAAGGTAFIVCALLIAGSCAAQPHLRPQVIVLGIAQDGGVPQAGDKDHRGWTDTSFKRLVSSVALVDPRTARRWFFDATPDFREQLYRLDQTFPVSDTPGVSGIFLTHGHMGHYTGLMFLGHESMGASGVQVYAMPRMRAYLANNGPWDQLVRMENIVLTAIEASVTVRLADSLSVTPFLVPHRQEYTEVVGYRIDGPSRSVVYIPDIDSWDGWDAQGTHLEDVLRDVDVAYLDGTFFSDGEIPGRDMSGFPHPFVTATMNRLLSLPESERGKVRFIHLNNSNPALWPDSEARKAIDASGFGVAEEMERVGL